jgi:hypothetical protein
LIFLYISYRNISINEKLVLFRLGRLSGVIDSSHWYVIPIIEHGIKVNLKPIEVNCKSVELTFIDREKLLIEYSYRFQVKDCVKAICEVEDYKFETDKVILDEIKNLISNKSDYIFKNRGKIQEEILRKSQNRCVIFGIIVDNFSLDNIK